MPALEFSRAAPHLTMSMKVGLLIRVFILSAGVLFAVTALAKLISGVIGGRSLEEPDPISNLPFRHVFIIAGLVELVVSIICFLEKRPKVRLVLIAWLATTFLAYRMLIASDVAM